jgi:hypothetical protein
MQLNEGHFAQAIQHNVANQAGPFHGFGCLQQNNTEGKQRLHFGATLAASAHQDILLIAC